MPEGPWPNHHPLVRADSANGCQGGGGAALTAEVTGVTVIIDLTLIRWGTSTSRLLDMVEGRSTAVFSTWLADRDQT